MCDYVNDKSSYKYVITILDKEMYIRVVTFPVLRLIHGINILK